MTASDPLTLIGGGSILVLMGVVFRLLVHRLTAQDTGWQGIVAQQKADLVDLRAALAADRVELARLANDLAVTRTELAAARLQIAELQRWGERRDQ